VIDAKTPMHVEAKMPVVLSAGDVLELPIRVTNETASVLAMKGGIVLPEWLHAQFTENPLSAFSVGAHDARTFYLPFEALPGRNRGGLTYYASSKGLTDTVTRQIRVEPVGFPIETSVNGTLADTRAATVVVTDDETHATLDTLNPGDIVKVEGTPGQPQRIVVLRRVWDELTSPEL